MSRESNDFNYVPKNNEFLYRHSLKSIKYLIPGRPTWWPVVLPVLLTNHTCSAFTLRTRTKLSNSALTKNYSQTHKHRWIGMGRWGILNMTSPKSVVRIMSTNNAWPFYGNLGVSVHPITRNENWISLITSWITSTRTCLTAIHLHHTETVPTLIPQDDLTLLRTSSRSSSFVRRILIGGVKVVYRWTG